MSTNPDDFTLVACRFPVPLKERAVAYCRQQDQSLSQIIRKGVQMVIDQGWDQPSGWLVRS